MNTAPRARSKYAVPETGARPQPCRFCVPRFVCQTLAPERASYALMPLKPPMITIALWPLIFVATIGWVCESPADEICQPRWICEIDAGVIADELGLKPVR